MTDLPKEDRDLIELVQSLCCPRVHGCEVNDADECPAQRVRQALAAARSEGPARAPVVDEGAVLAARDAIERLRDQSWPDEPTAYATAKAALIAALGASQ